MSRHKLTNLTTLMAASGLAITGLLAPPTGATPTAQTPDLATALTSKVQRAQGETAPEATPAQKTTLEDPAQIVRMIVSLEEETRDEAYEAIAHAIAAAYPQARTSSGTPTTRVSDYENVLSGFLIEAPRGALPLVQEIPGVKAAFIEREWKVESVGTVDAEGGTEGYTPPEQPIVNQSALLMMHADQVTQHGEGKVIAVVDTGMDTSHPAFTGELDKDQLALTKEKVDGLRSELGQGQTGPYISEKFPFVYDYADDDNDVTPGTQPEGFHGTHVAGILGANNGKIRGTAPQTQLLIMKVTRDEDDAMLDSAVLHALDDAAVLRPDSINLSIGYTAGMPTEVGTVYADVYKKLESLGVTVSAASGNASQAGYGNLSGRGLPYATDPDYAVMDEPATYTSALAVASVNNAQMFPAFTAAGRDIGYQRPRGLNGETVMSLEQLPPGTYEYVDGGYGSEEDAAALRQRYPEGLAGKIIVISRGKMTYQSKVEHMYDLHPAGIIVYNNVAVGSLVMMNLTTTDMPAGFITKGEGEAMLAAEDHHLTFAPNQVLPPTTKYSASEFSAWGVSPNLRLKPEIAAPGGDIYSSMPGGGYDQTSGTSMATPQIAGIATLVRQRIESDPLYASFNAEEKAKLIATLMMGTAHPIVDAEQDNGTYYSPRKIGSGLVDALAATTTSVYPTVEGALDWSRPKADLGDGENGWTFGVTLHNLSDTPKTYTISSQALSEMVEDGLFTLHARNWQDSGISVTYAGAPLGASGDKQTVTVPAKGESTVRITIKPGEEFANQAHALTPNGTFVDGFVQFDSTDDTPDLTVPYVGFFGNWGKPPVFDAKETDTTPAHKYASQLVNAQTGTSLGLNPLAPEGDKGTPDPSRYVVSRVNARGAATVIEPRTGTLRSVEHVTTTYTDQSGNVVRDYSSILNYKSLYSSDAVTWLEANHLSPQFDGFDKAGQQLPDGPYKLTISANTEGPSSTLHQISYDFRFDTTAPTVTNLAVTRGEDGKGEVHLSFDVTDASAIAGIDVHDPSDGLWYYRSLTPASDTPNEDGTHTSHFDIPLADLQTAWEYQGGSGNMPAIPTLMAWDYGLNGSEALPLDLNALTNGETPVAPMPQTSTPADQAGRWVHDAKGWWWSNPDGTWATNTTATIRGSVYRFGEEGYMRTGWVKDGESWYFHAASGAQRTGWMRDGGTWYYLTPGNGAMANGWVKDGNAWYYLNESGAMATGWLHDGSAWYYLNSSGAMATGWVRDGGTWYYMMPGSGVMATGSVQIGARTYNFAPSGAWMR